MEGCDAFDIEGLPELGPLVDFNEWLSRVETARASSPKEPSPADASVIKISIEKSTPELIIVTDDDDDDNDNMEMVAEDSRPLKRRR